MRSGSGVVAVSGEVTNTTRLFVRRRVKMARCCFETQFAPIGSVHPIMQRRECVQSVSAAMLVSTYAFQRARGACQYVTSGHKEHGGACATDCSPHGGRVEAQELRERLNTTQRSIHRHRVQPCVSRRGWHGERIALVGAVLRDILARVFHGNDQPFHDRRRRWLCVVRAPHQRRVPRKRCVRTSTRERSEWEATSVSGSRVHKKSGGTKPHRSLGITCHHDCCAFRRNMMLTQGVRIRAGLKFCVWPPSVQSTVVSLM
jgi:hypothetical protein